jgi:putative ABC transport system permease protein
VVWASKDFFKVFALPILEGNPEGILDQPNTLAISEKAAKKHFPNESALGKSLIIDNDMDFIISGVFADMPENSHFHFDFLLSMEGLDEAKDLVWLNNNFQTYLKIRADAQPENINAKFPSMLKKYVEPQLSFVFGEGANWDALVAAGAKMEYTLQPLLDIHLKSDLDGEFEPNFNITYVYLFIAIALFILILACINFMNLSTARSANRAKEVGIRKVMGSFRFHLIRQFLMESILLSFISFLIALPVVSLLLPLFNTLSGRSLSLPLDSVWFYSIWIGGALFTGLLAGVYPAFFLSGFKPISILKGKVSMGMKSGGIRSSLVVFQFAVSIILIIATITVFSQLNYIQNKEIGFNKNQVITVEETYVLGDQLASFKNEILANSMILGGTISGYLPVSGGWRSDSPWLVQGRDPKQPENFVSIQNWSGDYDYIKTLGMNIAEGRDFSADFPSDSSGVLINEIAAKRFNFEGNPVGQQIVSMVGSNGAGSENMITRTVLGVIEDFHFESLKESISPVLLIINENPNGPISFRFKSADTKEVIALVESKWNEMAPGQPFSYAFLDDRFGNMYASEIRLGKVFAIFAGFAILIACLGLFALTAFTAEQRTKEIGIRKVLGASVGGIVLLLSKDFTKLVLVAFVIASPLAWWIMDLWLKNYQYKVSFGWEVFLVAGAFVAIVAMLTISFQSMKAASSNPVDSLKSE